MANQSLRRQRAPRLAVFDLDGTLVDSQHMIVAAMGEAFQASGLAAPPAEAVRRVVGLSLGVIIARLAPGLDGAEQDAVKKSYRDAFSALREAGEAELIFDGAIQALDALAVAGWVLGIATGKSARGLKATLKHFDLCGRFVTLQTADRGPGKPAPDMLHRAMAEAGVEAGATVMIGDTSFDMAMAQNARVAAL
ncbi:MAG: HAD-IA family hydrolase, partial [Alphaproteobacteria bacterium]|nr:HAD-IA family hydrolase [Alphaproteobacteria bacterium]